jgi:starch synthase
MYAMLYGAIPVVHRTGGLADTVTDPAIASIAGTNATGFVFATWSERAFQNMIARALKVYADPERLNRMRYAAMAQDFSWEQSAAAYVDLFRGAIAKP